MADIVEMIQLSPTMEEGLIVQWLKKEGDSVEAGEILAEVETDKANMDMESFFDGVVLKILVEEGNPAKIGAAIAIIGEEGEDISDALEEAASASPAPAAAPAEPAAASAPVATPAAASVATSATPAPAAPTRADGRVLSSPLARKIAAEHGIDIALVRGSGPGGRVVKSDVERAVATGVAAPVSAAPAAPAQAAAPAKPAGQPYVSPVASLGAAQPPESIAMTPMRKAIAANLSVAWQAPAFMLTRDFDMGPVAALRKQINQGFADAGIDHKVSFNDMVIKACAKALIDVPAMNSAYQGDTVLQYKTADIGMAVALDGGLITPIIRQAEAKPLGQIAAEARELAGRARRKKLQPDEYTGATFSISNLGMMGIDHFTAVLNPPGAGILAVGAIRKEPVVNEAGEIVVGTRMAVTLTCDHRAVDGAVGATFLQRVAIYLEKPALMLV